MKDVAQTLQSGNAALFLMIRKMTADKVLEAVQGIGGTVMRPPSTTPKNRRCAMHWRPMR
jgi:uncharacterized membrane protein